MKTRAVDDLNQEHDVIAVKGSGADMAEIEPWGLPEVKLGPLREMRALDALSDEAMVNTQRLNLLNAAAPSSPRRRPPPLRMRPVSYLYVPNTLAVRCVALPPGAARPD